MCINCLVRTKMYILSINEDLMNKKDLLNKLLRQLQQPQGMISEPEREQIEKQIEEYEADM